MATTDATTHALKASKWPAFHPCVAAATIAVLVTSIVLTILAFRDPEMAKWGWAEVGVAALTLTVATAMIYALVRKRSQINSAISHASAAGNESSTSRIEGSQSAVPSEDRAPSSSPSPSVVESFEDISLREELKLVESLLNRNTLSPPDLKSIWLRLLNFSHPQFCPPFYDQNNTFRVDKTKLEKSNFSKKAQELIDTLCLVFQFKFPEQEMYTKREKELICYALANMRRSFNNRMIPAEQILEKISPNPEDHGDDFVVHVMEVHLDQKFRKDLPNPSRGQFWLPAIFVYTKKYKDVISSCADLPDWARTP